MGIVIIEVVPVLLGVVESWLQSRAESTDCLAPAAHLVKPVQCVKVIC